MGKRGEGLAAYNAARLKRRDETRIKKRDLEERYLREGAEAWRTGYFDHRGKVLAMPFGVGKGLPLSCAPLKDVRRLAAARVTAMREAYLIAAAKAEVLRRRVGGKRGERP